MADEGIAYVSGGEEPIDSDDEAEGEGEILLTQKRMLEKVIGEAFKASGGVSQESSFFRTDKYP